MLSTTRAQDSLNFTHSEAIRSSSSSSRRALCTAHISELFKRTWPIQLHSRDFTIRSALNDHSASHDVAGHTKIRLIGASTLANGRLVAGPGHISRSFSLTSKMNRGAPNSLCSMLRCTCSRLLGVLDLRVVIEHSFIDKIRMSAHSPYSSSSVIVNRPLVLALSKRLRPATFGNARQHPTELR